MSDVNFERDSFEAWYIAGVRKAVPAFAEWSDSEIREGCMRPENDSYRIDSARIALEAWQARAALTTGGQGQADKEMQLAMQESSSLAQSIFKRHYSDDEHYASGSVVWGLCDSLRGVISQIDNMTSGLVRAPQQEDARVALLTAIEDSGQGLRYELNCLVNNGINTFNVYDSQKEEFISAGWSTDPVAAIDSAAIAAAKEGSAG